MTIEPASVTTIKLDLIKVLFFDVFGTCVQQRTPVADELSNAAKEALKSGELDEGVRKKAEEMTYDDWFEFGGQWNAAEGPFVRESIAKHGTVDWIAVDAHRISLLSTLLAACGLILLDPSSPSSSPTALPGSLFTSTQLLHLGKIWHRLPPWPDTVPGLNLLNKRFKTATLSNTYNALIRELVSHSSLPFTEAFSSDLFGSYKPNPKVYLGAAERMGVRPEECALVAAHLGDLKGAKEVGFQAVYVERVLEEKAPELIGTGIPDLVVDGKGMEGKGGFVEVARRFGVKE